MIADHDRPLIVRESVDGCVSDVLGVQGGIAQNLGSANTFCATEAFRQVQPIQCRNPPNNLFRVWCSPEKSLTNSVLSVGHLKWGHFHSRVGLTRSTRCSTRNGLQNTHKMTMTQDEADGGAAAISYRRRCFHGLLLFVLAAVAVTWDSIFVVEEERHQSMVEVSDKKPTIVAFRYHQQAEVDDERQQRADKLKEKLHGQQQEQQGNSSQEEKHSQEQTGEEENDELEKQKKKEKDQLIEQQTTPPKEQSLKDKTDNKNSDDSKPRSQSLPPPTANMTFVDYPHKMIGMGKHANCVWKTRHTMTNDEMAILLGNDIDRPSGGQQRALNEGVCVPSNPYIRLHLYSRYEARRCLANKKVIFAGHDYNLDVYSGLRQIVVPSTSTPNDSPAAAIPVDIHWVCQEECKVGTIPWMYPCSSCINEAKDAVTVDSTTGTDTVGKGIHSYDDIVLVVRFNPQHVDFGLSAEEVVYQLLLMQKALNKTVVLPPPMFPSKDPVIVQDGRAGSLYSLHLAFMAENMSPDKRRPFVDTVPAERACRWENCTSSSDSSSITSGLPNAPFVNRWKAQLLLNSLCDRDDRPTLKQHSNVQASKPSVYDGWVRGSIAEKAFPKFQPATDNKSKQAQPKLALSPDLAVSEQTRLSTPFSYVPYPHRSIGFASDANCQWTGLDPSDDRAIDLLSFNRNGNEPIDIIQSTILEEGMCLPIRNNTERYVRSTNGKTDTSKNKEGTKDDSASLTADSSTPSPLRIFSASQARHCLANVTLGVTGDSYTRNLFIDFGATLLGRPTDIEIIGGNYRSDLLMLMNHELQQLHKLYPNDFPNVQWICHWECYGKLMPYHSKCSECVNKFRRQEQNKRPDGVAVFIGNGVHIRHSHDADLNATMQDIEQFWQESPGVLYATPVAYQTQKVPEAFRNSATMKRSDMMYYAEVDAEASTDGAIRLFDYFQLTKACWMDNCTYDGGHRARFVNRWKAQLLLNSLCG